MSPDIYRILGVARTAGAREIKRAYRRLALAWHPDRNPHDPRAAEKFRLAKEAYRILWDPVTRTRYDRQRSASLASRRSSRVAANVWRLPFSSPQTTKHPPPQAGPPPARKSRSRGLRRRPEAGLRHGNPPARRHRLAPLTPWRRWRERLLLWADRFSHWLRGKHKPVITWELIPSPGPHLIMDLRIPRWLAAKGTEVPIPPAVIPQIRPLRLVIPPGVRHGACLRLAGAVHPGPPAAHLYINILLVS